MGFTSDAQAQAFADTIWDLFLGGASPDRPFGAAVLDGYVPRPSLSLFVFFGFLTHTHTHSIDLDVEGGGSAHYAAFVTQLRAHASGASKRYYVTAAPQCPFPDANLGAVINAVGFDAVYVQFCECSVSRAIPTPLLALVRLSVYQSVLCPRTSVERKDKGGGGGGGEDIEQKKSPRRLGSAGLDRIGYVLSELETWNWN